MPVNRCPNCSTMVVSSMRQCPSCATAIGESGGTQVAPAAFGVAPTTPQMGPATAYGFDNQPPQAVAPQGPATSAWPPASAGYGSVPVATSMSGPPAATPPGMAGHYVPPGFAAPKKLLTGVDGPAALAATIASFQGWLLVVWGTLVAIAGNALSGTESHFVDTQGTGNNLMGIGLIGVLLGIGLLASIIGFLKGSKAGAVSMIAYQVLVILVMIAMVSDAGEPAMLLFAVFPIACIFSLVAPSTSRLCNESKLGYTSPLP